MSTIFIKRGSEDMRQIVLEPTIKHSKGQESILKNMWLLTGSIAGITGVVAIVVVYELTRATLPVPLTPFWNEQIMTFQSKTGITLQPQTSLDGYVHYFGRSSQPGQSTIEVVAQKGREPVGIYEVIPSAQSVGGDNPKLINYLDMVSATFAIGVDSSASTKTVELVKDWEDGKRDAIASGEWKLGVSPNSDGTVSILATRGDDSKLNFLTPSLLAGLTTSTTSTIGNSGTSAQGLYITVNNVFPIGGELDVSLTVENNSNQSMFVSPLDFTLSNKDGTTVSPANDSYSGFQGVTLQSGQKMKGTLAFNARYIDSTQLNYNGLAGLQQVNLTSGSGS